MKWISRSPGIFFSVSLIIFYLSIAQLSFCQDCKTQAANKPSTYDASFQHFVNPVGKPASWDISKMKPRLAKVESWMKTMLKGFTGAKLMYGNYYFLDPLRADIFYKTSGLENYYESTLLFFAYYCYDNNNKTFTEDESGSKIKVDFNNVFSSGLTSNAGVYSINGKPAFQIFQKKRSEGRIDFYEQRVQDNASAKMYTANDYIIIRNSDLPVFISVTRKEYLQQMLKDVENSGWGDTKAMSEIYTQNVKQFEAEMKAFKLDKNYTPEKEAKRRKWFEEDQEKLTKVINKINPDTEAAKAVILQYLKKPAEWLSRSFNNFYSYSTYTGNGVTQYLESLDRSFLKGEDETHYEIVSINPAYFNNHPDAGTPQLITVHLQNGTYAHMLKVRQLTMQPGALALLEAILSPGKEPIQQPLLASTSTYKLSFLPKLNKLPPLVVPPDMKPSVIAAIPVNNPPVNKVSFELPQLSPKLKQVPAPAFTAEMYKNYVQELHTKIANAIKPEIKNKVDDYLKSKKITQSKDISNTALGAWLQKTPKASLYLYSMAAMANLSDGLTANNFSAFLIMSGLPEKAIPVLEYWNKQQPRRATILANLGNAYYRLGNIVTAMNYLQQAVQQDSLNATANKILCIIYLKKGDVKKAEEHGTRSISTSHDQQVISILQQVNSKIKPGEVMSRFPALPEKEFPMLERIKLPMMPSRLDDMEQFSIDLNAIRESIKMTVAAIETKTPKQYDNMQQRAMATNFTKGIPAIRIKAQYIILDGLQTYQTEGIKEFDVFKYQLKKINAPYSIKVKAIVNKYNSQLSKLEGGEAGDEDKIAALELAKCRELNGEAEIYLAGLSRLVNQHAARQEYITRKFHRDYANWGAYWQPENVFSFPSIEKDYLSDVLNILGEYHVFTKINCALFEPLPIKEGTLQQWEDEYCANFKGKFGMGPAKLMWTCKSWGIEAGEGIVGAFEVNYTDDGSFEDVSFELGFGANWNMGTEHVAQIGAGASVKEFVKIGPDNLTGNWGVTDAGLKGEITIEGEIGNVSGEVKVIEVTAGYNSGVKKEGILVPILDLK